MPEKTTMRRLARDRREGKAASTQAGEFVREDMDHIREGKHGARSAKQAIAIGLSKARRAGVALPAPKKGNRKKDGAKKDNIGRKARTDTAAAAKHARPSRKRSRATLGALQREGHSAASHQALARQARAAARKRSSASKSASARRAARTRKAAAGK